MTFRPALAILLCLAPGVAAAQRVSFPSFAGPGAPAVRNQLVSQACDTVDCVNAQKTTTGGKPDWKKAKKESVRYFVTGTVVKKGKALSLDLQVFNKQGAPAAKKVLPLERGGTLSAKNLRAAMDLLTQVFGKPAAAPKEPAPPPPAPDEPPPPKPGPKERPRPSEPPVVKTPDEPKAPPPEEPPAPPASRTPKKPRFLVVDVGADVLNRRLSWTGVATANLRSYDLALYGQPSLGVQVYPLALLRDDLLAGLGAELTVAFAPWLQSRLASAPDAFPTSAVRVDGGVRFRLLPIKTFALALEPYLGVRSQSFTVGALADGRRLDGLPNLALVGLRLGLGVEVPVVPGWLVLFGRFGIVPVFGAGEIVSAAFFPNGSAFGFDVNAGVGVTVWKLLQLRGSFEFASYGLTFTTSATDPYVATGATDRYLGFNMSARLTF